MHSQSTKSIKDFFKINNTPDTTHLTQWETRKCIIRGTLIKMAVPKHTKEESINALLKQIQNPEQTHKLNKAQSTQKELGQVQEHLREELGKKIRKNFALSQKLFY